MPRGTYIRTKECRKKISIALIGRFAGKNHPMYGKHHSLETKKHWSLIRKGRKQSEETKTKISLAKKGKMPKNFGVQFTYKGKKHSEETKKKIGLAGRGRKISEETRKKLSLAGRKRVLSLETRKKIGDSHRGEKSVNWKGGINPINDTIRKSLEMKLWKKACLERDNFIDQKYGIKGGVLRVHHINNFADFPELRTTISNGITLSEKAHKKFHKIYGNKNNTREQLEEFLNKKYYEKI